MTQKINIKDLNLLVANKEFKNIDTKWIDDCIYFLIGARAAHCKIQLTEAIEKEEAFYMNHLDSQIVIYRDKDGNEYGHFSEPVYNNMIDFINYDIPINRGILQQALRSFFYIQENNSDTIKIKCQAWNRTPEDLFNALTELMLII